MKLSKVILTTLIFCFTLLLSFSKIHAITYDFILTNDTTVKYTTGNDYVEVINSFKREVKNSKYYVSTNGEKVFHIPDLLTEDEEKLKAEREFKKQSIQVKSKVGKDIGYTIEELENGEGMYVKVPNYTDTEYGSPYQITMSFNTHDILKKVNTWISLKYPILHEDTQFEQTDEQTGTKAKIEYNLNFEVDSNIPPLAKIYPMEYSTTSDTEKTLYSFSSTQRLGQPIYLEFGTTQTYRFEMTLNTSKTDNIIPEKYSENFPILSTNIYELYLPREFSENNQRVKIENISPSPTSITTDTEGNVLATFEVPANRNDEIYVSGYIWVEQDEYLNRPAVTNLTLEEYFEKISNDSNLYRYLTATKYWEIEDPFIIKQAENLLSEKTTVMDLIKADYTYVTDTLEYDSNKANTQDFTRIGAVSALQGGPSVCMEYSDSMIAILRAQGIPARAAFGYAFLDSEIINRIGHQWVQVWIPDYGWLTVDPTYESLNMLIGESLEHILWNSFYNEDMGGTYLYTADQQYEFDISSFNIKVYGIEEATIPNSVMSYSDIPLKENTLDIFPESVDTVIKTTPLGKALVIILPITVVLLLLIALFSLAVILTKRIKSRRASINQQP